MANFNRTKSILFSNINSSTLPTSYYDNQSGLFLPTASASIEKSSENLKLVENITIYTTLVVSIVGLVGNACTIVVLNRRSMRKWRSSMLLSALAAVDFLYLSIIFLSILDTLTNQRIGLHRSLILCQGTVYITHVCSFLSSSFTLSFTLQRFVAVLFPLHANTIISSRSSIINIILLLCFGCGFYSFSFFLTHIIDGQCTEDEKYPALFPLLIVDTCFTFVIPFICILLFNCAIVYKLRKRKRFASIFEGSLTTSTTVGSGIRQKPPPPDRLPGNNLYHERQRLYESNPSNNTNTNNHIPLKNGNKTSNGLTTANRRYSSNFNEATIKNNGYSSRLSHPRVSTVTITNELTPVSSSNSNHRQGISQRTTKMLVICSTTFLLFNSPYCAVLLYSIISKHVLFRTLGILRHFYFMSFCLNFFLYSLCGNRFRHELILLFKTFSRKCCTKNIRSHWLRIEKFPKQSSFTRVATRTNI